MNEKEFNLQVLAKLVEIANVIFAKLTINIEGTFTAAELWAGKNSLNENIVIDYHGTQFDTYTVEVGTFKCSFTPERIFYAVWKFEQLCHVRQENKARFTYGVEKREIITVKAMYIGKGEKVMKRKKTLVRLSEHVAYEPCKQFDSVDMYYFAGGIWYYVQRAYNESQLVDRMANKLENDTEWLKNTLNGIDYTQDIAINTIFKALRDVLCAEVIKDTPEERKCENEAENAVICDSERVNTSAKEFNKHEALKETEKRMREKHPDYISLIRYNGMYYSYGESAKNVRLLDGVRNYITDTGDYICFPESLLDEVLTKLIKAGRGVLTCDIIEDKPQQEDYPPEPYNKEKSENVATSYERFQDRTICGRFQKNMCPNYLRQKVFPTESFQSRRKIRRFKRLSFVGYTNYHSRGESVANQTEMGKSGGYSVVTIRMSTERKGKFNSHSP